MMAYRFIIKVNVTFKSYDRVNDIYVIDFIFFSLWQWLGFCNACDFDSISIYVQSLVYLYVLFFVLMIYFHIHALHFIIYHIWKRKEYLLTKRSMLAITMNEWNTCNDNDDI